jgi:hypothetical protein
MGCFGSYVVISSLDFSVWFGRAWVSVGFLVFAWMSCCLLFSAVFCFLFFVFFVFAWLAGSGAASVSTWISFRLYMEESTLATALGW